MKDEDTNEKINHAFAGAIYLYDHFYNLKNTNEVIQKCFIESVSLIILSHHSKPVSYTHLDVYKRQGKG